ncbi:MAG: hypothetical protein HXL32_03700 [Prevotellaceae bacterium]|nr:hypothetical protein [Prevotellaceae bacterium]
MRTLFAQFVLIVAFVCATNVSAQNQKQFDVQLGTTLRNINSDDAASVVKGIDELKHMASQYPDAWLPAYYQALEALQYAVKFPADSHSYAFLQTADSCIEALLANIDADKSEVLTLKGFYYTALIVQNPAERGKLYYMDAIDNFKSAVSTNPANPRPRLLLYIFFEQMSKVTGSPDMNSPKDLETIRQLLAGEHKTGLQPRWGKELLGYCGLK